MNEQDIRNWRKRLIFRSSHRGTREMDLIMGKFAREHVPHFSVEDLTAYEELLKENDPNLYNWIIGKEAPPANIPQAILNKIKALYLSA